MLDPLPIDQTVEHRAHPDRAGVIAPGPVIVAISIGAGWYLDGILPLGLLASVASFTRTLVAVALILLGSALILVAGAEFHRLKTPFLPWKSAKGIATVGIYSRTRNPMYQGLILVSIGIAILLQTDWGVIFLIPASLLIHFGVVLREERYLARKFGADYRVYMTSVPRYGWPFGW